MKLLPSRAKRKTPDYERLAGSLARMRRKQSYATTAWVFLADHGYAIIYPPYPLTISTMFKGCEGDLDDRQQRVVEPVARTAAITVRVFSVGVMPTVLQCSAVSKLRRPFPRHLLITGDER